MREGLVAPLMAASWALAVYAWVLLRGAKLSVDLEPDAQGSANTERARKRRDTLSERVVDALGRPLAPALGRMIGETRVDAYRRKLATAGSPGGLTVQRYLSRKAGAMALCTTAAVLFALQGRYWFALWFLIAGWASLDLWLNMMARRRQAQIQRELPDYLDVLAVAVTAGLGFRSALAQTADALGGVLAEEVGTTLRAMDLGVARRIALAELRERDPAPGLRQFVGAVLQSEELGTPLAAVVTAQAAEMRRERAGVAKRQASRADPQVTVIAGLFFLPAAALLIIATFLLTTLAEIGNVFRP